MPISLLEAMSFGRRCLASDIPENADLCGEHATYFRHGSSDDLAEKLRECIVPDPAFDSAAQTEWVRRHYDWDAVTEDTLALYEKAMGEKRGPFAALRQARKRRSGSA